jgi:hypothetical protein
MSLSLNTFINSNPEGVIYLICLSKIGSFPTKLMNSTSPDFDVRAETMEFLMDIARLDQWE